MYKDLLSHKKVVSIWTYYRPPARSLCRADPGQGCSGYSGPQPPLGERRAERRRPGDYRTPPAGRRDPRRAAARSPYLYGRRRDRQRTLLQFSREGGFVTSRGSYWRKSLNRGV